ncbi:hypothetical protein [Candidatus Nitrosocosmicus franklandus]|uniref:Uncharacterized protein n=1 Tax=Candidatus Nitrosocosmicus franklandianus TaxID=1798806 RepID=A0A484IE88_9ARCH|nr:hypothetical protein [Candidatus Nitrosocosmicus franklandus]VFJ14437.1 conserved protein of unknown function [Candidatus Nitrosocosmicus franklandus]
MPHNLVIRGFDDNTHSELRDLSKQKGVSINSIIKDAVDQWLKQQKEIPKRHHLLLYDNADTIRHLIKSLDYLTKEQNWFRCFVPSSDPSITELLRKMEWFDGTTQLYDTKQKDVKKYIFKILQNVSQNANNKQLCLVDFLINDIANYSVREASYLEKEYDKNRLQGLVFCAYEMGNLTKMPIIDMLEMFNVHDQVFVLTNDQIYKLHLTKENIHKLILS